jgi:transposase-like protein
MSIMTREEKQKRTFSETFKKAKVKEYEERKVTVLELSRLYEVTDSAVYKWIRKYGKMKRPERMVVEQESEERRIQKLLKQMQAQEQEIGRQQMEIRYLKTVLEYGSEILGEDLEKKVDRQF